MFGKTLVSLALLGAGYDVVTDMVGWAWVALFAALATGVAILRARPAPMYGAALAWALVAVAVQNWGAQVGLVALAGFGALAVLWFAAQGLRR